MALEGAFSRNPSTSAAPAVAPTGVISFFDGGSTGGTLLGSATPVFGVGGYATYEATINAANLSIGAHSIVAYYAGDSNYSASTSIVKPLTLTQATLAVSPVTIASGVSATTLAVNISFAGSPTAPTGAVLFTVDNGTTVAASCTSSGTTRICTASYPVGTLAVGVHTIMSVESGDAQYSLVSGTALLTVTGGQPSLAVVSAVSANAGGYLVTVTVTNTGNGTAQAVTVNGVTLGAAAGVPTPQPLGSIASGSSASTSFQVPASAGTAGSTVIEKVSGTYTGGSFGGSFRVSLPAPTTY